MFSREVLSGLALGAILGTIGLLRISIWQAGWGTYAHNYVIIAEAVPLALIGVVLFGSLVGAMLPFILRSLRMDPATASAPFVATLSDVTGLVIYFTVAKLVLHLHGISI